jgi:MFS family permease
VSGEDGGEPGTARDGLAAGRPGYREVFGLAEFRALWAAQLLSVAGDQLARVAVTVLVYDRTHSALLAASAYAASIVPAFLGGIALSGVTDRWPRRAVMIACDLLRVPLAVLMAVPRAPLPALVALLCVITALGAPFGSARSAILPQVLGEDRYPLGTAVMMTTYQFAQVAGFAAGGTLAAAASPRAALLADAGTFACSAVLVMLWVRPRAARLGGRGPAAGPGPPGCPHAAAAGLALGVLQRPRGPRGAAGQGCRGWAPRGGPDPGRGGPGVLRRVAGPDPAGRPGRQGALDSAPGGRRLRRADHGRAAPGPAGDAIDLAVLWLVRLLSGRG